MMTRSLFSPLSRLPHNTVSLLALGALIFLRIPFLASIATFWEQSATTAYFVFIVATYLITAFLIWWERERLRAFWIDLPAAIVFLCQMYMFPFGIGLFSAMRRSKAKFPAPPPGLLRWSLIGALLAVLATIFLIQANMTPPQQRSNNPAALITLFGLVLIQMVNAAVWEEPLFRGFLWGHLRLAGWKNGWIWVFQALLFTFAHFYYLREEPFVTFFLRMIIPALLLGFIAWRARSIFASMVTHGVFNASGDLLLHSSTLPEALRVAWTAAGILAVGLLAVTAWEIFHHRRDLRAAGKALVFFLKVFPMLPSRPIDWITPKPLVEKVVYPSCNGPVEGEVYRPSGPGERPGMLVCLGVVPFGADHPQVAVLGRALARSGFAALMYWSPDMRDMRLDPGDLENIPLAYDWLITQPGVDASRSGLLGTCVGGAFAMMAAAQPRIRDRVAFVSAYAPYASMWSFARDIASESRVLDGQRIPWKVDQLARKVFVHSITATLRPEEAERLRAAFANERGSIDGSALSSDAQAVLAVLAARDAGEAEGALHALPAAMQARLTAMSPATYLDEIRTPLFVQFHDVGDLVIPVGESRDLHAALAGRPGTHYTEMGFQHLDPVKGKLPLGTLVREFSKFFRAIIPLFRVVA